MAATYSLTPVGVFYSAIRNQLVCYATGAAETITLVHLLGQSPMEVKAIVRSVIAGGSGVPVFAVRSYNASQAIIDVAAIPNLGVGQFNVDFVAQYLTSPNW